jgi:predicted transcriptional regulator
MTAKTIRLPPEVAEWLRREAFERRVSQQSIIQEALELLRERQSWPASK